MENQASATFIWSQTYAQFSDWWLVLESSSWDRVPPVLFFCSSKISNHTSTAFWAALVNKGDQGFSSNRFWTNIYKHSIHIYILYISSELSSSSSSFNTVFEWKTGSLWKGKGEKRRSFEVLAISKTASSSGNGSFCSVAPGKAAGEVEEEEEEEEEEAGREVEIVTELTGRESTSSMKEEKWKEKGEEGI